jgi:hypothetical protein
MKLTPIELKLHKQQLIEDIESQRLELVHAYRGLGKPLAYTQTAIRGAQALKQNAWLIALLPTAISLAFSFFGWKKKGKTGLLGLLGLSPAEEEKAAMKQEMRQSASRLKRPLLRKMLGHGWSLFKIYRRVRPYFP